MTLDTFNARYLSQSSCVKMGSNGLATHSNERDRFDPTTTSNLQDLTQKAYLHATG